VSDLNGIPALRIEDLRKTYSNGFLADHAVDQGGLAGAVRSEQTEERAGLHL